LRSSGFSCGDYNAATPAQPLGSDTFVRIRSSLNTYQTLDLDKAYTLEFQAQLVDADPGAGSPMTQVAVEHSYRYDTGPVQPDGTADFSDLQAHDRFYVDTTLRTFQLSINPTAPLAYPAFAPSGDPTRPWHYVQFVRWRESGTGTLRISGLRIVEGLSEVRAPKRAFAGQRVAIDAEGNFTVEDPQCPAANRPCAMVPFFPISLAAGAADVTKIGKRKAIEAANNGGTLPAGVNNVGDIPADTSHDAAYRALGFGWLAQAGFNTIKGYPSRLDLVHEAYTNGSGHPFYSLLPIEYITQDTSKLKELSPGQGDEPTPRWTNYPRGVLAWWFDWEDHADYTRFAGWDSVVEKITTEEKALWSTSPVNNARRLHPIVVNSGFPGRWVAMQGASTTTAGWRAGKVGRADAFLGYADFDGKDPDASSTTERSLAAQEIPFAGSGMFFKSDYIVPATMTSASADVAHFQALEWDSIATGSKMLHWYPYAMDMYSTTMALCPYAKLTEYNDYQTKCAHADDLSNAPLWNALGPLHAKIQEAIKFIAAPRASWTPVLDSTFQRHVNVLGKDVAGKSLILVTNPTADQATNVPLTFTRQGYSATRLVHVTRLSPVDPLPPAPAYPVATIARNTVTLPAYSANVFRVEWTRSPPRRATPARNRLSRP
jgi:hypothetical protein